MTLSSTTAPGRPPTRAELLPWLLVLLGLCALYLPTFYDFAQGPWRGDRNSHGPIVLAISAWFFHFQAQRLRREAQPMPVQPAPVRGWAVLVFGLLVYCLGRSQSLAMLELGSMIPVLLGGVLIGFGPAIARRFWFAFFLLLFAMPLPASVVDVITQPLKIGASYAAEHLMYWMGYPVARAGVILSVGPYQLLVADACSGLNSLFTLEALGLLYMNVVRHESVFRNFTLAALIVPISFSSNVIRIMILALLTFYFGDEVGQGFMHAFSGMVLFLVALLLIVFVDTTLRTLSSRLRRTAA